MGVFEGKSPAERNKIIAAIVLGVLAVASLAYTFGGSIFSGSTKVSVDVDASPTASVSPDGSQGNTTQINAPVEEEIYSAYTVTPVFFGGVPDLGGIGGRNIFAFYEPGRPTPTPSIIPGTPIETRTPFEPTPAPTRYPMQVSFVNPQSKYAGEGGFQIEVVGDKFKPESKIVFNGTPLQTNFISEQKLTANVPANFISSAGFGTVLVDTFDGKNFSNQMSFNIQAPPKPTVEYIGMIARRHYNNDTAYFEKKGDKEPVGKRLNDVVEGRFKLISISEREVEFEDTRLGFRHKLEMKRPDPGSSSNQPFSRPTTGPVRRRNGGSVINNTDCVPGIPCDLPRATPRRIPNQPDPNSNVKRP